MTAHTCSAKINIYPTGPLKTLDREVGDMNNRTTHSNDSSERKPCHYNKEAKKASNSLRNSYFIDTPYRYILETSDEIGGKELQVTRKKEGRNRLE